MTLDRPARLVHRRPVHDDRGRVVVLARRPAAAALHAARDGRPELCADPDRADPEAAVGAAPIATAPIATAPIPTAPIATAPIPTAPIASAPIATAPIATRGLFGLPIPTAGVANPLDAILLSSIPNLNVTAIFACTATTAGETNISGKLPQQYTLGDIYRSPCATAYFNANYKAADVPLGGTLLRGIRTLSYLLGGKPLDRDQPRHPVLHGADERGRKLRRRRPPRRRLSGST